MKKIQFIFLALLFGCSLKAQWVHVNTGITNPPAAWAIATDGTDLYAGIADSVSGGVFISSDMGNSWTAVNSGLAGLDVRSIAVSGLNVFAGVMGHGMFLSTDHGSTWNEINSGLTEMYINTIVVSGSNVYIGTMHNGVYKASITSGTYNWTAINSGLSCLDVRSLAIRNDSLFAGIYSGGLTCGGVFFSANDGASWTQINSGLTNLDVWSLLIHNSTLLAGTGMSTLPSAPEVVSTTITGSMTWVNSNAGIPGDAVISLHKIGNTIFAGGAANTATSGFYYSIDGGSTWSLLNTGLSSGWIFSQASIGSTLFIASNAFDGGIYKRNVSGIVGIESYSSAIEVSVFPNPVTDKFEVLVKGKDVIVQVTDMLGKLIIGSTPVKESLEIDISDQPKGIYFVRVTDTQGNGAAKKIVKE